MTYIHRMKNKEWKESVRRALSGLPKNVQTSDVARETGIDANRLYAFVSKGYLNSDELKILDDWLTQKGFREQDPVVTVSAGTRSEPSSVVADIINGLEGWLPLVKNPDLEDSERLRLLEANLQMLLALIQRMREVPPQREETED
jgi:hypothetical protein